MLTELYSNQEHLKNGSPNNTWGCKGLELGQDNILVSNQPLKYTVSNFWRQN